MKNFVSRMKQQEEYLSEKNRCALYETLILEDNGNNYGVLISKTSPSYFIKSVYTESSDGRLEYIGFQSNDDNSLIYPFEGHNKKELQDILWNVCSKGYKI